MSRRQLPRAAAATLDAATFLPGEIAVDTTNDELRYDGDGSTVGGIALARKDGANASATATGGSTANTLSSRFGWQLHLQDFGAATPDNSTDATTTINAANTAGGRIVVPITSAGSIYATSHDDPTQDLLNAVWLGPGRIEINGYAQAPFRSIISAEQTAPASNDRYRFFNEGFPKANRASFMGVYGSSVTPSAGSYTNFPQLAYDVLIYDNTAGFNASASSHTSGRSGIFASFNRLYHGGQGDLVARHVYLEGYSARASATHWLANPALVVDNGNLGISAAGGAGTYMNHSEFTYSDNGYRAAVIDRVRNYDRDSNTTTLGEVWLHDRPQSVGTYDADCVYSVAGKWKRGLDFTPTTFDSDKAAIIIKANDRIYLAGSSTADSSGAQWFATSLGTPYIYSTGTDFRSSVALAVDSGGTGFQLAQGADIASATTTDIGAATGPYVHITGTTTITGLGTVAAGTRRTVKFTGALTLTHNATSLILPGSANITTAANDSAEFASLGSGNWVCLWYNRASGKPVAVAFTDLTGSASVAQMGSTSYAAASLEFVVAVNFNSANTDHAINISLPTGFTRYVINALRSMSPDGTLASVTIGLFTATGGGGTAIVTSGSGIGVTTGSENTSGNVAGSTINNAATTHYRLVDVPTLYYRVQTPQGAARSGYAILTIVPIP